MENSTVINCGEEISGFKFTQVTPLPEIEGCAFEAVHEFSGAKLLYLQNQDSNKSFAIGFRTPPADDTGVFHILEHSVLCGSKRYPVKEPFVDLLKSSMQTFLNAMTFPDKTVYPVASTNDKDLENLMSVYLDAVFYPQIYWKPEIFQQEGWHYELRTSNGEMPNASDSLEQCNLTYNGVVFNEMKGALSDSQSVLYNEISKALFPNTCYRFESGGTPGGIVNLTYENYLDEHRCHYRTDNAYIILYGNLDIQKALAFIDQEYLTPVARAQKDQDQERLSSGRNPFRPRALTMQEPVQASHFKYSMVTAPENACAACAYCIGTANEVLKLSAAEILLYSYFGNNEAPLKRALLDLGLGHDITASLNDSILQPFVDVTVNMPKPSAAEKLSETVRAEVEKILAGGLDKTLIEAAISHIEFMLREGSTSTADGVIYAIKSLNGWLYDDDGALSYVAYEETFKQLREALNSDYYECLMADIFLNCNHTASGQIIPVAEDNNDPLKESLKDVETTLTAADRQAIVEAEIKLRKHQEEPDSPEAIATLPRLSLSDLGDGPKPTPYEITEVEGARCVYHKVPAHGIAYGYRYFNLDCVAFEELGYVSLLAKVLGRLSTKSHSAAELSILKKANLGSVSFRVENVVPKDPSAPLVANFVVGASALDSKVSWIATLPKEILLETIFDDKPRILDMLKQAKISLEQAFIGSGNASALLRALAYSSQAGAMSDSLANVGYYQFLCNLLDNYDAEYPALIEKLQSLGSRIFNDAECIFSFGGSQEAFDEFWAANPKLGISHSGEKVLKVQPLGELNEAFVIPSDVAFNATSAKMVESSSYSGQWRVAAKALNYDYLWNAVRVKGGAYGVGFKVSRDERISLSSYRDPNVDATYERFSECGPWLEKAPISQQQLEGFIIATVSTIDRPEKPRSLIRLQDKQFLSGYSFEDRMKTRSEAMNCTLEDFQKLAPAISESLNQGSRCMFGPKALIEDSNMAWEVVGLLEN